VTETTTKKGLADRKCFIKHGDKKYPVPDYMPFMRQVFPFRVNQQIEIANLGSFILIGRTITPTRIDDRLHVEYLFEVEALV
jgi:hypothetical protein